MRTTVVVCAALLFALPAVADEPPVPKLFRDIAAEEGQWRMHILEIERDGQAQPPRVPTISLCTDNVLKPREARGAARAECSYRIEKDTSDEAVIESTCPDRTSRVALKREGANSVLMQVESRGARGPARMKTRFTYEGACREGQGAMSFDKESEACRQMRAQAALMDPAQSCANAGAQRGECEARMRAAVEQMSAMCR